MIKKKFRINKYITLKLENDKTEIYVLGKRFQQCKKLILNITQDNLQKANSIKSIDEANKIFRKISAEETKMKEGFYLTAEQEFLGHCSNLQAWCENEYNPRLLHSNLAFPLLKKLKDEGDKLASHRYFEELYKRFFQSKDTIREFLFEEGYFDDLPKEEKYNLLKFEKERSGFRKMEKVLGREIPIWGSKTRIEINLENNVVQGIFLKNERLKNLPKCLLNFDHLEVLSIENHSFTSLPNWIDKLNNLKNLKIVSYGNRSLTLKLSNNLSQLKHLNKLDLSGNGITSLPENFSSFKSLKYLDLGYNKISKLPNDFGNIEALETFRLYHNPLKKLPQSFSMLFNLKKLDLFNLPLEELPKNFENLKSLKELDLSGTRIKKLPVKFGNLSSLERLIMKKDGSIVNTTPLEKLPESIGNLTLLKELVISGGKLKNLPDNLFKLKKLEKLDLSFNKLTSLPQNIYKLKSLKWLSFQNNLNDQLPRKLKDLKPLDNLKC